MTVGYKEEPERLRVKNSMGKMKKPRPDSSPLAHMHIHLNYLPKSLATVWLALSKLETGVVQSSKS